jgi:hypothetical protein
MGDVLCWPSRGASEVIAEVSYNSTLEFAVLVGFLRTCVVLLYGLFGLPAAAATDAHFVKLENERDPYIVGRVGVLIFQAMQDDVAIDELENAARIFREKQSKTELGDWKLTAFYNGVMLSASDRRVAGLVARWAARWPQSPVPAIIQGHVNLSEVLGSVMLTKSSFRDDQSRVVDKAKVAQIVEQLSGNRAVARIDPHWFVLMARALSANGATEAVVQSVIQEGLSLFPTYTALYDIGTEYYLGSHPGDTAALERWAQTASLQLKGTSSASVYARIYWHAFEVQYGRSLLSATQIDWTRFKEDPTPGNFGRVALIACVAGDRAETRRLFESSPQPLQFYPWAATSERDSCRDWAMKPSWRIAVETMWDWIEPVVRVALRLWNLVH